MRSDRGQILPLALISFLFLAAAWVALIKTGRLIHDRIQLQNAADTAAFSACAIRARALNSIGWLNAWLGTPVLGIGWPKAAWWTAPPHKIDAGTIKGQLRDLTKDFGRIKNEFGESRKGGAAMAGLNLLLHTGTLMMAASYDTHPSHPINRARAQKRFITALRDLQVAYNRAYGGGRAAALALTIARSQGAESVLAPPGSYSLHLEPNLGPIWYWGTLHVWVRGKALVAVPAPPSENDMEDDPNTKRWYQQGPDFYRQSIQVRALRRDPNLIATAAARAYNVRGPMFPTRAQSQGFFGGEAALTQYRKAAPRWQVQLIPRSLTHAL